MMFAVTSWYFTHKEYFPADGELGQLYFKAVNYSRDFTKMESLINDLENQTDIIKNVDSWMKEYKVRRSYFARCIMNVSGLR